MGVDLRQLIGRKQLTTACTLAINGYGVTTRALINSGANGFVFINTICAANAARYLCIKSQRLPCSIPVKGYNSNLGKPVSHYLQLHLTIDS
jgi:hypothetical protein